VLNRNNHFEFEIKGETTIMATNLPDPYIPQNPGDLITAENWNEMQVDIKQDIASQITTAIAGIKSVSHADDAHTLDGQDTKALTDSILKQAEEILPQRTGYFRSFNRLKTGTEKIIKHGLKSFPLADIYILDYFPAVCSTGDNDATPMWVNFFLYHSSERTITVKGTPPIKVPIEPSDVQPFRVLFSDMLALYKVQYTDTSTLDELETEFWKAFWASNDEFDSDQYCHSPWFEKCCGEKRSVRQLKDQGAWDDIWFKMVPTKIHTNLDFSDIKALASEKANPQANPPTTFLDQSAESLKESAVVRPPFSPVTPMLASIEVNQHDFDTVGIVLRADPVYPKRFNADTFALPESFKNELKIMVLLKV
jgi:hypothetical protein